MGFSPLIDKLIAALTCLPGIGPKSAQRMAFYILDRNRQGGRYIASTLQAAIEKVKHCEQCRIFSEDALCGICSNAARDKSTICVVESPVDVEMIEQVGSYNGLYFVLMGHLSPLDSIGPEEIGVKHFQQRLSASSGSYLPIREVILATSTTVGGEATAYYLAEITKAYNILTTRIAYGVPMGGELKYLDGGTVAKALELRHEVFR